MDPSDDEIVASTRRWIERAVIGLRLCPFAAEPFDDGRIRYCVSRARSADELVADLAVELRRLDAADPADCETTLLIHPDVLGDFFDFNDFLDLVDATLDALDLADDIQVATFHPRFQFAQTAPDDVENCTNRSPYPTLHLLRQASIERAVAAFGDTAKIYEGNIATLRGLGVDGWRRLWSDV
jgi:uncharacterized protein